MCLAHSTLTRCVAVSVILQGPSRVATSGNCANALNWNWYLWLNWACQLVRVSAATSLQPHLRQNAQHASIRHCTLSILYDNDEMRWYVMPVLGGLSYAFSHRRKAIYEPTTPRLSLTESNDRRHQQVRYRENAIPVILTQCTIEHNAIFFQQLSFFPEN